MEMKKVKIRITKDIENLYQQYKPKVGKIYDAEYIESSISYQRGRDVCVINIADKRILVREDEFEIVEG